MIYATPFPGPSSRWIHVMISEVDLGFAALDICWCTVMRDAYIGTISEIGNGITSI